MPTLPCPALVGPHQLCCAALTAARLILHPSPAVRAVEVGEVTFRFPVEIGDLLRMRTLVLHTWVHPGRPGQGRAHVQVEASVTQPEKRQRCA